MAATSVTRSCSILRAHSRRFRRSLESVENIGRKYAEFVVGSLSQLRRSPFLASQAVHAAFTRSRVSTTFASAECGSRSQCSTKSALSHFPPNFVISIRSLPDLYRAQSQPDWLRGQKKGRHAESFFDRHAGLVWESVTSNSREAGGLDVPFAPKLQAFECLEHHHELVFQSQAQRPHLLGHCRGAQLRRSPCRLRLLGQHSACVGVKRWKRARDAHHRWSCHSMRGGAR
jgi:hypothetical protein